MLTIDSVPLCVTHVKKLKLFCSYNVTLKYSLLIYRSEKGRGTILIINLTIFHAFKSCYQKK